MTGAVQRSIAAGGPATRPWRERRALLGAAAIWTAVLVGAVVTALQHPERHNVVPACRAVAVVWGHAEPMYGPGIHGFCPTTFAPLFALFAALGSPLDEPLLRARPAPSTQAVA